MLSLTPLPSGERIKVRGRTHAPVAQWIEQRPPEPCVEVRFLSGAVSLEIKLMLILPISVGGRFGLKARADFDRLMIGGSWGYSMRS